MPPDRNIPSLFYKDIQDLLIVSLTVNFCVLWHVLAPGLCTILATCLGGEKGENFIKNCKRTPGSFNRLCTSVLFYTALPVCGIAILAATKVLQNPFFEFDRGIAVVFSINVGFYIFRLVQILYYHRSVPHYQALTIHHAVTIATYISIFHYEQNAISGVIGLLTEGNLVFIEFERLLNFLNVPKDSKVWKVSVALRTILTVLGKALVPVGFLAYVFATSSKQLFQMNYIPLAFFFMGLVFFSCVNVWFIKDALVDGWQFFRRSKESKTVYNLPDHGLMTTVVNHEGLLKLSQQFYGAEVNITCNDLWEIEAELYEEKQKNHEVIALDGLSPSVIKTTNFV